MAAHAAILIPCYNAGAFLPELFTGIHAQTVAFCEIVCYDDASTDNTAAVAKSLGARVIHGEVNHGAAYARNRLLENCNSEWVHFHDADDLIHPTFLERMLIEIRSQPGAIICNIDVRDRQSRAILGKVDYSGLDGSPDPVEFFLRNIGFITNGLYSSDWLERIGGFNESLRCHEDPDLHVRLAAAGCPFKYLSDQLVTKLEHTTSYSATNRLQCAIDKLICLENYSRSLGEKYRRFIGEEALRAASALYLMQFDGRNRWIDRALILAKYCGADGAACESPLKNFIARIVGVKNVLRFRLIRKKLGSIALWAL